MRLDDLIRLARISLSPNLIRLSISVTHMCNKRCSTCNLWRLGTYGFSPEELERALDYDGVRWITIGGGEPFLRADLPDIVRVLASKERKLEILLIDTNGYLGEGIVEKVVWIRDVLREEGSKALLKISVSLHGDEEKHDRLMNVPGSWRSAVDAIKALKESGFDVHIATLLTRENEGGLRDVIEIADRLGLGRDKIAIMVPTAGFGFGWEGKPVHELFSPSDLKLAVDKLSGLGKIYAKMALETLERDGHPHMTIRCASGRRALFIDADLKVYPCPVRNDLLGDLREETLTQVMKRASEYDFSGCRMCINNCGLVPSILSLPHGLKALRYLL